MVRPRHQRVPAVAVDDEVRHVVVQRQAVRGRVCLQEAAVFLAADLLRDLFDRVVAEVDPRAQAEEVTRCLTVGPQQ